MKAEGGNAFPLYYQETKKITAENRFATSSAKGKVFQNN